MLTTLLYTLYLNKLKMLMLKCHLFGVSCVWQFGQMITTAGLSVQRSDKSVSCGYVDG